MSKSKLKIAFYWAASCGGCEIAVLDLNEKILDVVQLADIVFWPVAMDIKYKDIEALPDKHIDITFFNGSIRNSEQEHMAKVLRQKPNLSCFRSCAHEGVSRFSKPQRQAEFLINLHKRQIQHQPSSSYT
jgi:F420-non-reducing hydrogenase small subunit